MKAALQLAAISVLMSIFTSCKTPRGEFFVHQKIPIEIQSGKATTVKIHVSVTGANQVGIRCSPEVWNVLTNGTKNISVQLLSSNGKGTQISEISPGSRRLWPIESYYSLFYILGEYHANASVEITFPNAPAEATRAEIIVCKTPADTKF